MNRPGARWGQAALGLIILALVALVLVPISAGRRTQALRSEINTVAEPARALADRMQTTLAREVAAIRGYLIARDSSFVSLYREARIEQEAAHRQLQALAPALGPQVTERLVALREATAEWQVLNDQLIGGEISPEALAVRLGGQQERYGAVVAAGNRLDELLAREIMRRREGIREAEQRALLLSSALAGLALLAALAVAMLAARLQRLTRETERLYHESRGLATNLETTVEELQQRTAEAEAEVRERRRAEEALLAEEERFRALADNIPQLAWMADDTGSIFWYNRRWYEYTGTAFDEMQGWGWKAVHHPGHLPQVVERFSQAIQEAGSWEDTFPLRSREGEYRWFLSRAVPIRNQAGEVALWFGTNTDITDQREAAAERERLGAEIQRQRNVLKTVTDNATSALLMMDSEGRGTFWNPAAEHMTGYPAEEVIGRRIHELIHHTHPDGTPFPTEECPIDRALPQGVEVEGYEDVFIRKNGEFFPVVCAAKPIVENGRPEGTVIEVRDVTEEKRAEEALVRAKEEAEQASRAKSAFLATMSHELRTPLNAILGFSDLLAIGIPDPLPHRCRPHVRRIEDSARHLLNIIEQILTFSRVEAEQEAVAAEIMDVREVVRSAVEMIGPLAEKKGLRLVTDLEGAPEAIRSDPQKLRQILLNLLGNAIKFTEAGRVELAAWHEDGNLVLRVRDTGIGIAPEDLSRVFDAFWQVDQSHTRKAGGTGLGLTVSRSLARLLGGDVIAFSEPGEGSTFELRLPAQVEPQVPASTPGAGR